MKRLISLLLVFIVFAQTGCDKTDDEPTSPFQRKTTSIKATDVVGEWKYVKRVWLSQIAGKPEPYVTPAEFEEVITFYTDNTYTRSTSGTVTTGTYRVHELTAPEWVVILENNQTSRSTSLSTGDSNFLIEDHTPSDGPMYYFQKVTSSTGTTPR